MYSGGLQANMIKVLDKIYHISNKDGQKTCIAIRDYLCFGKHSVARGCVLLFTGHISQRPQFATLCTRRKCNRHLPMESISDFVDSFLCISYPSYYFKVSRM
jgi:hypothetical protein